MRRWPNVAGDGGHDRPSVRVVLLDRRPHRLFRRRRNQPVGVERLVPLQQVLGRGVQRACGVWLLHIEWRRVPDVRRPAGVAGRAARNDRGGPVVAAVGHCQRSKDLLPHHVLIFFSGRFFEDRTEQEVAGIVVGELLSGSPLQREIAEEADHLVDCLWRHHDLSPFGQPGVARDAGRVRQEVMDRHRLPRLGTRRDVEAHRILQFQFALFPQLHDGHRRELLGDRPDAKLRLRRVRDLPFDVCQTVAFRDQRLAFTGEQDRAAESVRFHVALHVLVDLGRERRGIERRGARRRDGGGWRCGRGSLSQDDRT